MDFKYMPIFRGRQQEFIVLRNFSFGEKIMPLIEIIKEKDRSNNPLAPHEIILELVESVSANKIAIDLPVYLSLSTSTADEVIKFYRKVISSVTERIKFFNSLSSQNDKIIPVISSLLFQTGEVETIKIQYDSLKEVYPCIAIRLFFNGFNETKADVLKCALRANDFIIFDLDTVPVSNPIIRKYSNEFKKELPDTFKVLVRSAINTDIQNVKLPEGDVIGEADNSLLEQFKAYSFNAFGDYVGIKKDEMPAGGGISPGFIFYDPLDNVYYGYKGDIRKLQEFEKKIVPQVLSSNVVNRILNEKPQYLNDENKGYKTLLNIQAHEESGKSQAKFKKISMEHYLHCIKININENKIS
jgi:hypothetical protein